MGAEPRVLSERVLKMRPKPVTPRLEFRLQAAGPVNPLKAELPTEIPPFQPAASATEKSPGCLWVTPANFVFQPATLNLLLPYG